ncbi:MAG TPA: hypothetical protein VHX38_22080 [Pseudonocardiaceae bacterium]|jgi:hypothetical protein|nr:hypothetical protein [Pseudonocardiaceae bacterium]
MNEQQDSDRQVQRRPFDPILLILGLVTLGAAGYILSYGYFQLPHLDPRWVLAGAGLLVGLLMLVASLRPKRRRNR